MSKILVAYSTSSGSTAEVANAVAEELKQAGHVTEVLPVTSVKTLDGYDSIVLGAPMIFGWHNPARKFLQQHRVDLAGKKVALFASALRLTQVPDEILPAVPLALDPNLVDGPQKAGSLGIKERFTTIGHYLQPMLQAAPSVVPVSVAFFKGKLEMYRLAWWQAAFVMIVVQAVPGDYRDFDFIRTWGKSLARLL